MGGKTQKVTQKVDYPAWVDQMGESIGPMVSSHAEALGNKPFEAYTGQRVADFTGDQTNAFQQLRDLIAGAPQVYPTTSSWITSAATAGPQSVSTERVVDEGGRLGAISDYMNPYTEQALAPALRKIDEAAAAGRKRIGAGATMAGAFGDARHGIMESQNERDRVQAYGDTAYRGLADAFNQAMGHRTGDLGRFGQVDLANAQLGETALGRLMSGAGALQTGATADQQRMLQQISSLLETGGRQQGLEQLGLDKDFEEFMRGQGWDFNVLSALTGALKGTPVDSTTTNTTPNNSGLGALGSIFGALMSPVASGGTTALGSLLALSDERTKEDIAPIGELADGKTVYRFRYKGDPKTHVGLMAQEVEETDPDAVTEIAGVKFVDYDKATRPSAFAALFERALAA